MPRPPKLKVDTLGLKSRIKANNEEVNLLKSAGASPLRVSMKQKLANAQTDSLMRARGKKKK